MMPMPAVALQPAAAAPAVMPPWLRILVAGTLAFLTVVDLFATQAILPALVRRYGTTPAAMSFAVNASTIGMAAAGVAMSLFSQGLNRRRGILLSLALLAVPTALLGLMPPLAVFTGLRILQGLCMATAFTLTLAWLAETSTPSQAASGFAAYITGNVASNLFGRLLSAGVADHFGLAWNFYTFALLNLSGLLLVHLTVRNTPAPAAAMMATMQRHAAAWRQHLRNPGLRAAFSVGFCILFAFISTFTYVNFQLAGDQFGLGMMRLGLVYFVFLPAIFTTPLAGRVALARGTRRTCALALALALAGLPLLLLISLPAVLLGLTLVSAGTFFAQATATGFVGRAATADRAAASGLYLGCYFLGGLVGSAVSGQIFDRFGWPATVAAIAVALTAAIALTPALRVRQ